VGEGPGGVRDGVALGLGLGVGEADGLGLGVGVRVGVGVLRFVFALKAVLKFGRVVVLMAVPEL
jgi:hypothetical protein